MRDRMSLDRARALRRALTPPEVALWSQIKSRRLDGLHFRVQHPVGPYVLDFYCEAARLAVEVDGVGHLFGDNPGRDARGDAWFLARGIRTLRFNACDVRGDLAPILDTIRASARAPSVPSGQLPRLAGEPRDAKPPPPAGEDGRRPGGGE